jgi:hypothetical protein
MAEQATRQPPALDLYTKRFRGLKGPRSPGLKVQGFHQSARLNLRPKQDRVLAQTLKPLHGYPGLHLNLFR